MKQNSKELGFIPLTAVEKAINEDRLFTHRSKDNKIHGYLMFGPIKRGKKVTIYQTCIMRESRYKGFGKELVNRLISRAKENGAKGIRLRCAHDLEANKFWRSLGFKLSSIDCSGKRRINEYYLPIRTISDEEVESIRNLIKINSEELAYTSNILPYNISDLLEKAYDQDRLIFYNKNNKLNGYLIFTPIKKDRKATISQLALIIGKNSEKVAEYLVEKLLKLAIEKEAKKINVLCPIKSSANRFWQLRGFKLQQIDLNKNLNEYAYQFRKEKKKD
jgi:N-acetylglutamate synthase-like GNAT family acetyltransferase